MVKPYQRIGASHYCDRTLEARQSHHDEARASKHTFGILSRYLRKPGTEFLVRIYVLEEQNL